MEVVILRLSVCIGQIWLWPRELIEFWLYSPFLCLFGPVGHTSYFIYANNSEDAFCLGYLHADLFSVGMLEQSLQQNGFMILVSASRQR